MRQRIIIIPLISTLALLSLGCTANSTAVSNSAATSTYQNASSQKQQYITIIGASTPYPAMQALAKAYAENNPNTTITFLDSSQSSGGIAAVKENLADIGTVTRSPKPEETVESLQHQNIAEDALLLATHPSVGNLDSLTTENLKSIYSGEVTNWKTFGGPDADIVVLDRAEDTSAKRLLREYYLGKTLKNASEAVVLHRESNIIEALQNTPYSIGPISRAAAISQNLPINHLKLDGISPTPQNIKTDKYPMHRTLGIVWSGEPTETVQSFLDFVFSPLGAETLEQAGFSPIAQSSVNP